MDNQQQHIWGMEKNAGMQILDMEKIAGMHAPGT